MATFGQLIKELRHAKNMTLDQVADKAGISLSFLSFIERDKRTPPDAATIRKIFKALGESRRVSEGLRLAEQSQLEIRLQQALKSLPEKQQNVMLLLARHTGDQNLWNRVGEAVNGCE